WQFYAKHHSGSLESFSRQFRLRNLAVSSAAFSLLAMGLAFALIASERSRAIGKMQLEFAAGLSHELRTPLTVIRSAGYNLIHGNVGSRNEIVRYGAMIQQEGARLSGWLSRHCCSLRLRPAVISTNAIALRSRPSSKMPSNRAVKYWRNTHASSFQI